MKEGKGREGREGNGRGGKGRERRKTSYGRDLESFRLLMGKLVKIRVILTAVLYMRAELTQKKSRLHGSDHKNA